MANINDNFESSQSQCAKILSWLEEGHTITSLEALQRFQCMRLASRITDLRNRGVDVLKRRVQTTSGKYVAEYYLEKTSK